MKKSVMSAVGSSEMSGASRWLAAWAACGPVPRAKSARKRAPTASPSAMTIFLFSTPLVLPSLLPDPVCFPLFARVLLPVRVESPPSWTGSPEGWLLALLVGVARAGIRLVGEDGQPRAVRAVDAVAERHL